MNPPLLTCICGGLFVPKRADQKICLREECKKERTRRYQKDYYGKYVKKGKSR